MSPSDPFPLSPTGAVSTGKLSIGVFPGLSNSFQSEDLSLAAEPKKMTTSSPCPGEDAFSQ